MRALASVVLAAAVVGGATPAHSDPSALAAGAAPAAVEAVPAATMAAAVPPPAEAIAEAEVKKPAPPPPPRVIARIDLSSQRLTVTIDGKAAHSWAISSGREGFGTPTGSFRPQWAAKMWYSRKYDMAPMPHAVFFNGGIATHATSSTGLLGRPASHGCIRLAPANAATFYSLVHKHGFQATRIIVQGAPPSSAVARRNRQNLDVAARAPSRQQQPARVAVRHAGPPGYTPVAQYSAGYYVPRQAIVQRNAAPVQHRGPLRYSANGGGQIRR